MSNGIPPLLPASPPPMCKIDFDEDELDNDDENEDDFGDFSTAIPNHITSNSIHEGNVPDDQNYSLHVRTSPETIVEKIAPITSSPSVHHINQIPKCIVETPFTDIVVSRDTSYLEDEQPETKSIPNLLSTLVPNPTNGDDSDCDKPNCNSVREHSSTISSKSVSADDLSIELVLPSCDDRVEDNTSENFYDMGFCINERTLSPENENQSCDSKVFNRTNSVLELDENPWNEVEVTKRKQDEIIAKSYQQIDKTEDEMVNYERKESSVDVDDEFVFTSSNVEEPNVNEQNAFELNESQSVIAESNCREQYFTQDDVDEEDDDFSDFVSPSNFVSNEPLPTLTNDSVLKNDSISSYHESLTLVFNKYVENWNEVFETPLEVLESVEVNLNSIEGRLNGSSVWCRIKDIHASPALNYTWAESESNKMLLSTLYVDTRNILFGPRWNSEVPRFASNLGFTPLIPQKTSAKTETSTKLTTTNATDFLDSSTSRSTFSEVNDEPQSSKTGLASVPDAHFDWNNSGLTNPLDSRKPIEKDEGNRESNYESFTASRPPISSIGDGQQNLSQEAREVLENLPNLVVMEKQYIVFPIR